MNSPNKFVLVRAAGDPNTLTPAIKAIVGSVDTGLFPTITPLTAGFRKSVYPRCGTDCGDHQPVRQHCGSFSRLWGLFGLVSYAVSQRTKEIAIRLALGANRAEIFSAVLRRFAWPVSVGLIVGVVATAGLAQILRRVLYGISGLDPISYMGAMALLLAILTAAAFLPVRRAFQLDVARTLHFE